MAMPAKKFRKIVVDAIEYRWACSETWEPRCERGTHENAFGLSLMIETVGDIPVRLVDRASFPATALAGDCHEPGVVIQPRHVAAVIKQARESGWSPETDRKQKSVDFLHDIIRNDDHYGYF